MFNRIVTAALLGLALLSGAPAAFADDENKIVLGSERKSGTVVFVTINRNDSAFPKSQLPTTQLPQSQLPQTTIPQSSLFAVER
jgi:hypothetical protein